MSAPSDSREVAYGVGSQLLSSLTNFGASGAALLLLDASSFGKFVILAATYNIALALQRSLVCEPLVSFESAARGGDATVLSLGIGAVVGTLALLSSVLLGVFPVTLSLVVLAAFPLLMLLDLARFEAFGEVRSLSALKIDLAWGLGQLVAVAVLFLVEDPTTSFAATGWLGSGALVGFVILLRRLGELRSVRLKQLWLALAGDSGSLLSVLQENAALRFAPQFAVLLAGFVLVDAEMGEAFAPRTVMGPVNILFVSVSSYGLALGKRLLSRSNGELERMSALLRVLMPAVALVFAMVIVALPNTIIQLFSDDTANFRLLLVVTAIGMAFAGRNHARRIFLRVRGHLRMTATVQSITGLLILVLVPLGGIVFGSSGVVGAFMLAQMISVPLWMRTPTEPVNEVTI